MVVKGLVEETMIWRSSSPQDYCLVGVEALEVEAELDMELVGQDRGYTLEEWQLQAVELVVELVFVEFAELLVVVEFVELFVVVEFFVILAVVEFVE